MITTLYSGQSVNIKNFGVFSLSARTAGVLDVKECTAKNIKAVKINFRPSSTVRPDIAATRAGQKIDFYDLEALVNKGDGEGGSSGGGSARETERFGRRPGGKSVRMKRKDKREKINMFFCLKNAANHSV